MRFRLLFLHQSSQYFVTIISKSFLASVKAFNNFEEKAPLCPLIIIWKALSVLYAAL